MDYFQDAKEYENRRNKMLELLYFIRDEYNVMEDSEEDTMKGDYLREIESELEKIHVRVITHINVKSN